MNDFDRAEDVVRTAITELRAADLKSVPGFEAVLAPRRAQPRIGVPWVALGGVAATLLIALALVRATRAAPLTVPQEVLALSAWTPPTDVLLKEARNHLPTRAPRFGASLLDTLNGDFR
jgi:hypothetical protein